MKTQPNGQKKENESFGFALRNKFDNNNIHFATTKFYSLIV